MRRALTALVRQGELVEIRIAGFGEASFFAPRDALALRSPVANGAVRFLSPFDNLVIQRKRLKWLFDFEYVVEIYVPAAKRKYGYFVLPILWGAQLIGRMDAKAYRAERQLVIHNLIFEPGFQDLTAVRPVLSKALDEFARFQDCDDWMISRIEPKAFRDLANGRTRPQSDLRPRANSSTLPGK